MGATQKRKSPFPPKQALKVKKSDTGIFQSEWNVKSVPSIAQIDEDDLTTTEVADHDASEGDQDATDDNIQSDTGDTTADENDGVEDVSHDEDEGSGAGSSGDESEGEVLEKNGKGRKKSVKSMVQSLIKSLTEPMADTKKLKGARDPLTREWLRQCPVAVFATLFKSKPGLIKTFFGRFSEIWVRSTDEHMDKVGSMYFEELSKDSLKIKGRERRDILAFSLKKIFTSLALYSCKDHIGGKQQSECWRLSRCLSSIIEDLLKTKYASVVQDVGFGILRGLVVLTARFLVKEHQLTGQQKKKKSAKALKAIDRELKTKLFSWCTLFTSYAWIQATTSANCLSKLAEGWAILLLTLINRTVESKPYHPFALKLLLLVNLLSSKTDKFAPTGVYIVQILAQLVTDPPVPSTASSSLLKPLEPNAILKLDKNRLSSIKVRESLRSEALRVTTDFLALLAAHPAFPETSNLILYHLKKFAKLSKAPGFRQRLKSIIEESEATRKLVEAERMSLDPATIPSKLGIISTKKFPIVQLNQEPFKYFYPRN